MPCLKQIKSPHQATCIDGMKLLQGPPALQPSEAPVSPRSQILDSGARFFSAEAIQEMLTAIKSAPL